MKVVRLFIIIYLLLVGAGTAAIGAPADHVAVQPSTAKGLPTVATPNQTKSITDIYDILPPQPMAADYFLFAMMLIGAMICFALLTAVLVYLYRRRKKKIQTQQIIYIPPDETALTALARLSENPDFCARKFYFTLSLIVRQYIQDRFKTNAVEMTLEEILPMVARLYLTEAQKRYLKKFFISSDEIKFAKMTTGKAIAENDLQLAIQFVKQTRPREEASGPDPIHEQLELRQN